MSALLRLPRELRDEIIYAFLDAPITVASTVQRKPCRGPCGPPELERLIHYLDCEDAHRPSALNLLLTCRQLYAEVREVVQKRPINFTLDLAIINNCWFWPTFRFIPTRCSPCLERMEITIYPCHVPGKEPYFSVHQMLTTFVNFMYRFFATGALPEMKTARIEPLACPYNLRVKWLHLNVIVNSPHEGVLSHEQLPGRCVMSFEPLSNISPHAADGDRSLEIWTRFIEELAAELEYPVHEEGTNVLALLERVGTISLALDGTIMHTIDVSEAVNNLDVHFNPSLRQDTRDLRKQLGLEG